MSQASTSHAGALLRVGLAFPVLMTGVALPLDFIREVDGYLKYVEPWELARIYAWGWVLCGLVGLAIAVAACLLSALLAGIGRKAGFRFALRAVEWLALTGMALLVLRTTKLWMEANEWQAAAWMARFKYEIALAAAAGCVLWIWREHGLPFGIASLAIVSSAAGLAVSVAAWLASPTMLGRSTDLAAFPANAPDRQPDVVLITIDTLSADHMSLYGYGRPTTPNIERFAKTSDVFERFYANSNLTTPSVASCVHGVRPWTHRALQPNARLTAEAANNGLVARLKRAGYHTMAVATNPLAAPSQNGSYAWFDEAVEGRISTLFPLALSRDPHGRAAAAMGSFAMAYGFVDRLLDRAGVHRKQNKYDPELAISAARKMFGERPRSAPAFLWVHLLPPHDPYATPEPFLGRFDPRPSARTRFDSSPPALFLAGVEPTFPDRVVGRYDESIAYVDHFVGRFLDWMKDDASYAGSFVVITADHGESFVKGYGGHTGPLLHESLIRVPLIIKAPGQRAGQRINVVAEQIDLMPTILALAGVSAKDRFEGRSLVPAMKGHEMPGAVFSMNFEQSNRFGLLDRGSVAMIEARWKYVHYFGAIRYPMMPPLRDALYDLDADPGENKNLAGEQPVIAARMLSEIRSQLSRHGRVLE